MKRIKAACLEQTIHFQLKEDMPQEEAIRLVDAEYQHYRSSMDRCQTAYRILAEERQTDGSLIIKLKKQYNQYDCTPYMN